MRRGRLSAPGRAVAAVEHGRPARSVHGPLGAFGALGRSVGHGPDHHHGGPHGYTGDGADESPHRGAGQEAHDDGRAGQRRAAAYRAALSASLASVAACSAAS